MDTLSLLFFAFVAGLIDAVSGGGGLVQLPALLVTYPQTGLSLLFGTNKFASAWGTGLASVRFARRVSIPWRTIGPATASAFVFSFLGARCTALLNPDYARPAIIVMTTLVLVYTLFKPDLGSEHAPRYSTRVQCGIGIGVGAVIGFYDGIFGPGTGSFLVFSLVVLLGFDFLHASAGAKVMNLATNLAALCYFIPTRNVLYTLAIGMAAANMLGAILGTHLALSRGARFVRAVFIVMSAALIVRQVQLL